MGCPPIYDYDLAQIAEKCAGERALPDFGGSNKSPEALRILYICSK